MKDGLFKGLELDFLNLELDLLTNRVRDSYHIHFYQFALRI